MVIDTSAIVAILTAEPEASLFVESIEADPIRLISAAALLEISIVIESRHGIAGGEKLDELVNAAQMSIEPVTAVQITVARQAYRTYGKGQHPARLNFGDCFSYALAKVTGEPLLFKGEDFNQTDLHLVL